MKDVVEQELYVVDWRLIGRHRFSPGSRHDPKLPGPAAPKGRQHCSWALGGRKGGKSDTLGRDRAAADVFLRGT
jgi:hypothetical protein